MYVFLQERDSLCYESVASENSTSKSKYFIIQRAHIQAKEVYRSRDLPLLPSTRSSTLSSYLPNGPQS